jgi:hypothetical protein
MTLVAFWPADDGTGVFFDKLLIYLSWLAHAYAHDTPVEEAREGRGGTGWGSIFYVTLWVSPHGYQTLPILFSLSRCTVEVSMRVAGTHVTLPSGLGGR